MDKRRDVISDAKFCARIARDVQKRLGCVDCPPIRLQVVEDDLEVTGGGCCKSALAVEVFFFVMGALGHDLADEDLSVDFEFEGAPMGRPN